MTNFSTGRFVVRPRWQNKGAAVDLSKYLVNFGRQFAMSGVGSWSAVIEVPSTHTDTLTLLESRLRDGDWGELVLMVDGRPSHMEIILRGVRDRGRYSSATGGKTRVWTITGESWARALQTEVRLASLFYGASSVTANPSTPGANDSAAVDKHSVSEHPRIPGFLDTKSRAELLELIAKSTAITPGEATAQAAPAFKRLLQLLLWGTWVDSDTSRGSILQKLDEEGWSRFGRPHSVPGIPWRLTQLAPATSISPHSLLNQYGCLAFNEVFYDYSLTHPDRPCIVYRPRPFDKGRWDKLPTTDIPSGVLSDYDFSRTGAERFDYWNPIASVVGLNGADMTLDPEGKIPLVDRTSLMRHGLRPAEFQDDFYPLTNKPSQAALKWYRNRLAQFRSWYYHNPEMLTGSITLNVAIPSVKLGTRIKINIPYGFRSGNTEFKAPYFYGYVTSITDSLSINPSDGSTSSSMTIQFIRGQPEGGLPLPSAWNWRR